MISIIIPTFNRAELLRCTLASISQQLSEDVEILVIDNGSTDNTRDIVESFAKSSINYIHDDTPGLLTGRHRGLLEAKGDILVFLDDDVELSEGYVHGVENAFSNPEVKLATGPALPKYDCYPPFWLSYFWNSYEKHGRYCYWLSLLDLGGTEIYINPNFVWGLNFAIRKDALRELGGFHPDSLPKQFQRFQGDGETGLTLKALKKGYKALYHPNMLLYHRVTKPRLSIDYFCKRAFYQGICNSFTSLRQHALNKSNSHKSLTLTIKDNLRGYYHQSKTFMKFANSHPPEIKAIFEKLKVEEQKGYDFHQKAYKEDPRVSKWVLKKDYLDYKLPE